MPAPAALLIGTPAGVVTARAALPEPLYSHTYRRDRVGAALRRGPARSQLILTNKSTLPWLLIKTPSILVGRANIVADRLQAQLQGGFSPRSWSCKPSGPPRRRDYQMNPTRTGCPRL